MDFQITLLNRFCNRIFLGAICFFLNKMKVWQRVIKQTTNQDLPEHFQTSEFLLEKGFIDFVADRKELKQSLSNVMEVLIWKIIKLS